MADYITRAKTIIANIKNKDQVVPPNPFLFKVVHAFVRKYPNQWTANLAILGLVTNPATTDPLDIGTVDASDPPVFTPANAATTNSALAFHYIEIQRDFNKTIVIADQRDTVAAVAGDAGKTPEQIAAENRAEAVVETDTELGTRDNDPEV